MAYCKCDRMKWSWLVVSLSRYTKDLKKNCENPNQYIKPSSRNLTRDFDHCEELLIIESRRLVVGVRDGKEK